MTLTWCRNAYRLPTSRPNWAWEVHLGLAVRMQDAGVSGAGLAGKFEKLLTSGCLPLAWVTACFQTLQVIWKASWLLGVCSSRWVLPEIPYSFTVELPDKGRYGFLLPASEIKSVGEELWEATGVVSWKIVFSCVWKISFFLCFLASEGSCSSSKWTRSSQLSGEKSRSCIRPKKHLVTESVSY